MTTDEVKPSPLGAHKQIIAVGIDTQSTQLRYWAFKNSLKILKC